MAHGSSHPETHTHYVEYFYDVDKNPYMETYGCDVVVSVVDTVHLKQGRYKSKYILPSEFKKLMLAIPQNTRYIGFLSVNAFNCVVDSHDNVVSCDYIAADVIKHGCSVER